MAHPLSTIKISFAHSLSLPTECIEVIPCYFQIRNIYRSYFEYEWLSEIVDSNDISDWIGYD